MTPLAHRSPSAFVAASLFDGKSAAAQPVQISFSQGNWLVYQSDEEPRPYPIADVKVQEATKYTPRRLALPDGAVLEVTDQMAFERLLTQSGVRRSLVDRAQNSWRLAVGALALSLVVVLATYFWLLPLGSQVIASQIPVSVEKSMGEQAWELMEGRMFQASELPIERQEALQRAFAQIAATDPVLATYQPKLLFRRMQSAPNAFALPGGRVVLTDEMLQLSKQLGAVGDQALLGVLAHELGHVAKRHSLRQVVQATALTALISVWTGDLSPIVVGMPAAIAELKYSRDFENEADQYAIERLHSAGIDPRPTGQLFSLLLDKEGGASNSILSTHPPTAERVKRFEQARP